MYVLPFLHNHTLNLSSIVYFLKNKTKNYRSFFREFNIDILKNKNFKIILRQIIVFLPKKMNIYFD